MNFNRTILSQLLAWKKSPFRKPLIIRGARQVGKTSILKEFGSRHFEDIAYFNFELNPALKEIFIKSKEVTKVLANLTLLHGKPIKPNDTLIVFDEIQECNEALNTLKYFCEDAPEYAVASAGSLLGITLGKPAGFPVGKVDFLQMYPITFAEFLELKNSTVYAYYKSIHAGEKVLDIFFSQLLDIYNQYLTSGGMPEAAAYLIEHENINQTFTVQLQIKNAFLLDISKHAEKNEVPRIIEILNSVPSQLSKENKKFLYQVVKSGARARQYELALLWLQEAGLIYKIHRAEKPGLPLSHYDDFGAFKIYLFDIGILRSLSGLELNAIVNRNQLFIHFKGAFAENYVLQSLVFQFEILPRYWTSESIAEVDFLIQYRNLIIPIEVKSGENTKSKSLRSYDQKYKPLLKIRYSLKNLEYNNELLNIPIFLADKTKEFIDTIYDQLIFRHTSNP